jgi:hypothetical protein
MAEQERSCHLAHNARGKRINQEFAFLGVSAVIKASVQFEIADRLSSIRRLFRLLYRFLEFLFQQFGGMFLRFYRLPKNRVAPPVLRFHGARRFFHILKHLRLDRSDMRNHAPRCAINLEHSPATWARYVEIGIPFTHRRIIPHPDQSGEGVTH